MISLASPQFSNGLYEDRCGGVWRAKLFCKIDSCVKTPHESIDEGNDYKTWKCFGCLAVYVV